MTILAPLVPPVSQSSYFAHMDPNVFPDPHRFNSERWVNASKDLGRSSWPSARGLDNVLGCGIVMSTGYANLSLQFSLAYIERAIPYTSGYRQSS
ncbi:hypothetical protein ASPSYDRAFT_51954 [Aspergillus sydowii CBS 593.65]|uniref:Uncharacterized protein n=1 Tax=Aspergillus sydowii CBS 593.65 TaxID=1036612 RepID=A0A1L9SZD5_9EURO|nr:uncharacterized protein ASPSYDRAFT_51954 [Aspergillus sydowii CBS 593.65]OJJ52538.1 hypothetical protein ASPSYDRAFT_51954 [Aspergillus sydowii CBS 593.65]